MSKYTSEVFNLTEVAVRNVPGRTGVLLRRAYWRRRLRHLGRNVVIGTNVVIRNPGSISIGDDSWIDDNVILIAGPLVAGERHVEWKTTERFAGEPGHLHIGAGCHIAPFVVLQGHGGVWIGDASSVATGSQVYSLSHHYRVKGDTSGTVYRYSPRVPGREQSLICAPVHVGDDAAITLQCILLPGASVGDRTWLTPMSVLSGTLPDDVIASGNPAAVVRAIR